LRNVPADRRPLLRSWIAQLTTDPLDPCREGERRYVQLEHAGRDEIDTLHSTINLAEETTTQLLSGPAGSGKTTELNRLRGLLRNDGFTVVMVEISQYVNQSSEIDITDFLIALGLACSEQLLPLEVQRREGFAARFRDFLRRVKVTLDVGGVTGEISAEGVSASYSGIGVEIDLKKELKSSEPFVAELRRRLAFQVGELYTEVAGFLQELVQRDRETNEGASGVVVIVDSLEKMHGTVANDERVQASVEALFVHHSSKLRFSSHHMVYTVPTYLAFTDPGMLPFDGPVRQVPIPQVSNAAGERDGKAQATLDALVEAVNRRIPWPDLLDGRELLERVIRASDGHLRDLFELLQELITLVFSRRLELPVDDTAVDEALARVGHGFANITQEDGEFLRWIDSQRGVIEPPAGQVHRLARLMNTHMVLGHLNHESWYEVHPLARRALRR
jgi:energy-coupling factor transporter ATP-binding protein EcfA2